MSWATLRRVKEGLRQAVGISQSIEDEYFDEQIRTWEGRVQDIRKLKETIELYLDSLALASMAGLALSEAVSKLAANTRAVNDRSHHHGVSMSSESKDCSTLFTHINLDINNTMYGALRAAVINRCLKPLTIILTNVSITYEKITRRKSILIDFNAYSNKAHRESKANNPHLNRTTHKLEDVTKELANLQADILNAVADMDEAVSDAVIAELASLSASLYYYHSSSAMLMGQMMPLVPQGATTLCLLSMATSSAQQLNSPLVAQRIRTARSATNSYASSPRSVGSAQVHNLGTFSSSNSNTPAPTPLGHVPRMPHTVGSVSWDELERPSARETRRSGHKYSDSKELASMMSTVKAFETDSCVSSRSVSPVTSGGNNAPQNHVTDCLSGRSNYSCSSQTTDASGILSGTSNVSSLSSNSSTASPVQPPKPPKPARRDKPEKPRRVQIESQKAVEALERDSDMGGEIK
jgi:hypothetical protein